MHKALKNNGGKQDMHYDMKKVVIDIYPDGLDNNKGNGTLFLHLLVNGLYGFVEGTQIIAFQLHALVTIHSFLHHCII